MNETIQIRRTTILKGVFATVAGVFLFVPFVDAAADPNPAASASASASAAAPNEPVLSAALFSGTTTAPSEDAWKKAPHMKGLRMGAEARAHHCYAKQIAEWVRIQCGDLSADQVDLLGGDKRDTKIFKADREDYTLYGDNVAAQFSMHQGDRRVIQWISPDLWWSVWQGDEGKMASGITTVGPQFGAVAQVDWASGPEPIITIY